MIRWISLIVALNICMGINAENQDIKGKKDKKEQSVTLYGSVKDSFTKAGVEGVFVTLMTADSVVVDTMRPYHFDSWMSTKASSMYIFKVPRKAGKYIIKGEQENYETTYLNYEIKHIGRNSNYEVPALLMKKLNLKAKENQEKVDSIMRERDKELSAIDTTQVSEAYLDSVISKWDKVLDEVVVKTTRVKMIFKGDTVIYNADAFNLPEGSMLDDLIRQLDGVELSDEGEIKVNGEKIDELTLNGKDFFRGNNKVMLENLPHYTVDNVQVYRKISDEDKWRGRETKQRQKVMDVVLKREYRKGYIANIEVAGGKPMSNDNPLTSNDDLYLARLFGLRYTDNSRLSVFGNINNVNENRKPGSKGEWDPANMPQGQFKTSMVGADLLIDQADGVWKENASITAAWTRSFNETLTSSEQFLSEGSTFSRSRTANTARSFNIGGNNLFEYRKGNYRVHSRFNLNYTKNKQRGNSLSANTDSNPSEFGNAMAVLDSVFAASINPQLQQILVNRSRNESYNTGDVFSSSMEASMNKKLQIGDELSFGVSGNYSNQNSESFSQQDVIYYRLSDANVDINRYNNRPNRSYNYGGTASYSINFNSEITLAADYSYGQEYQSQSDEAYRLDRLAGWSVNGGHSIGALPSTRDSLLMSIDASNSYDRSDMKHIHRGGLNFIYNHDGEKTRMWSYAGLDINNTNEHMHYASAQMDTTMRQNKWTLAPSIYFSMTTKDWSKELSFHYNMDMGLPSLYDMVDVKNDQDPLNVRLGNKDLKGTTTHNFELQLMSRNNERGEWISLNMGANIFLNQVSQGYTYNAATGGYTFRPMNVNGNWGANINGAYHTALDKAKKLSITNSTNVAYNRNVDFAAYEGTSDSGLSKVNNWNIGDNLSIDYKINGNLNIGVQGRINYRNATSERETFETVNATNFSYGGTLSWKAPWKFQLNTDIKMYSRKGYSEASLNTNDLVWNASISRAFLKGQLVARLDAFDILGQLSSTNITINGQGRTETIQNNLPRYLMLHLQWNLHKMPKLSDKKLNKLKN